MNLGLCRALASVSIRSPHGCKGRYGIQDVSHGARGVSIRSPHGCKGRFEQPAPVIRAETAFQSAPLTDVRGDSYPTTLTKWVGSFNPLPSLM